MDKTWGLFRSFICPSLVHCYYCDLILTLRIAKGSYSTKCNSYCPFFFIYVIVIRYEINVKYYAFVVNRLSTVSYLLTKYNKEIKMKRKINGKQYHEVLHVFSSCFVPRKDECRRNWIKNIFTFFFCYYVPFQILENHHRKTIPRKNSYWVFKNRNK